MEINFGKYQKSDKNTKVLLLHILLNNYDLSKVERLVEEEDVREFGLKIKKVYAITKEYIDAQAISNAVNGIQVPTICSPQSYEYYSDSPVIHSYTPQDESRPLFINDLNVISKVMIITEECIVSSNIARSMIDVETSSLGFMYFYDYVMKSDMRIGKWHITYEDKVFNIYYLSENNGEVNEELLYSAIEIDKNSTYKLVIYVIKKQARCVEKWLPDNFSEQAYELVVRNE